MPEGQVLEFTRVTKRFNDVTAVSDFSARVEPGVVTAFLGPNGAGKTTTLRILLGQLRATSGTATIGGVSYAELRQPLRTIGAVLEETPYRPRRTANRQLTIAAKANGIPLSRIDEVLTMVGLAGEGETRLGGYSLGMRQRLNVATALLGDPGALVFDEPANGLDPEGIRWMRLLMRRLADEGRTVLVSSHVLSEVEQVADNVLVLSKGQLVLASGIEKLADPAAGSVVVDADDRAALTTALSAAGFDVEVLRSGLTVRGGDAATVGAVAASAGIALSTLVQRGPTLEDVFIDLVRGGTLEPRAEAVASQLVDQERNGAVPVAPVAGPASAEPGSDAVDADADTDADADEADGADAEPAADSAPVPSPVAAGVVTAGAAGLFGATVADEAPADSAPVSAPEDTAAAEAPEGALGLFGDAVTPVDAPSEDLASDEVEFEAGPDEAEVEDDAHVASTDADSDATDDSDDSDATEPEPEPEPTSGTGIDWHAAPAAEPVASDGEPVTAAAEGGIAGWTETDASDDEESSTPKPSFDDILFGAAPVSATAATAAFSPVIESDESTPEATDAVADGDAESAQEDAASQDADAAPASETISESDAESEGDAADSDDDEHEHEHEGIEIFAALGDDHETTSEEHDDDDPRSAAVSSMLAAAARAYFEDEPKDYPLNQAIASSEDESVDDGSSEDDGAHWAVAPTGVIDTVPLARAEGEPSGDEPSSSTDQEAEPTADDANESGDNDHDADAAQQGDEHHSEHGHEHEQNHDHHGDEHHHHG
ncbi:ATP-binding cassette domain-containing protein [Microbacterium sp. LTA6]|uniref:ATP-binding cassette domain-containing protein n=1 Tax=Microbacterium sp. LTA6 TaxID=3129771 RepID=UPI00324343AB